MAINRAPFNALVDDDGSNTIGTPWNKAAIQGVILDPVDAALAALPVPGLPADVPYNAANFGPAGGTWSVDPADVLLHRWTRLSPHQVHYTFYFTGTTIWNGVTTELSVLNLPFYMTVNQTLRLGFCTVNGTLFEVVAQTNGTTLRFYRSDFSPFPATQNGGTFSGTFVFEVS